jgi:ERCC4-type nuclease
MGAGCRLDPGWIAQTNPEIQTQEPRPTTRPTENAGQLTEQTMPKTKPQPPLPADLRPEQITVIVDRREQLPWSFPHFRTAAGTLDAGDYSILGLEGIVAVERKSLNDLIGCCGHERPRSDHEERTDKDIVGF